ncbi:hypothetical protein GQX74_002276 [Glossina fuscipes]|nr:hypothetical protein GQX74_002276 [Glossina fuscipes]
MRFNFSLFSLFIAFMILRILFTYVNASILDSLFNSVNEAVDIQVSDIGELDPGQDDKRNDKPACTNSRIAVTAKCMRLKYGFKSLPSWRAFNSSCSHSSARAQADSSQSVVPISLAPSELSTLSAGTRSIES